MEIKQINCDKCGMLISEGDRNFVSYVDRIIENVPNQKHSDIYRYKHQQVNLDLCPNCFQQIKLFFGKGMIKNV